MKIAVFIMIIVDTTVLYTKNKTLIYRAIMRQDKHITLLLQGDNYCHQNFVKKHFNTYY